MSQPSQLNINESLVAFSDPGMTNNPLMKHFDWARNLNNLEVFNPKAEQHVIPPRSRLSVFDTLRTTGFDGTTQVSLSYLADSTYRFKHRSGTDPLFAVDIPLIAGATSFGVVVNPNQTVTVTANASTFDNATVGSYVYIYSLLDSPTAAFSILNSGVWVVLGKTSNAVVTLARPSGTPFQGTSETVAVGPVDNMICYTLGAVQVGDKIRLYAPFSVTNQQTFVVSALTSKWVDVVSTVPLAPETLLPGANGMVFYGAAKRFTRVECDQRAKVYFNGSISEFDEIEPWSPGDRKLMGWQEKVGPVWSLAVYNLSNVPMTINVFSCE